MQTRPSYKCEFYIFLLGILLYATGLLMLYFSGKGTDHFHPHLVFIGYSLIIFSFVFVLCVLSILNCLEGRRASTLGDHFTELNENIV